MNLRQIQEDIAQGEGMHREFKEARDQLPRNLFETVCAFLNTDGGTLFLGVADDGTVIGIDPDAAGRMKTDLANLSNNPQKIDPPWLLFPHTFKLEEKTIIAVQVPLSSQLHKTNGHIILRSEDGDYRVQGTHQLAGLLNRKLGLFTEQRTLPHSSIDDLRPDLFDRARRLMHSYNSRHPWANLTNEELLKIGGFHAVDPESGKTCLTLAAILMFGTDLAIQRAVPAYKFDCLLRRENTERYDDRLMIHTNLIDAYDQMMGFVEKHLNDPFHLEGDMRISLRDRIFREAVSNIVSHREYTSAAPARLIIHKDRVILDNPCTQHHFGEITPENLRPYSKNPVICKFMIQLGRFDELGSGVTNINRYLPLYAPGAKPRFKETTHGFELTIPLARPEKEPIQTQEAQVEAQVRHKLRHKLGPSRDQVETRVAIRILKACREQPISSGDIAAALGHKSLSGNLRTALPHLRTLGLIEYTIPEKPQSKQQKHRLTPKGIALIEAEFPDDTGEVTPHATPHATPEVTGEVGTKQGPSRDQVGTKSGPSQTQEAQAEAIIKLTATEKGLLETCKEQEFDGRKLAEAVGYTTRTGNYKRALAKLLQDKLLEMTIPDKPRSQNQKYRLTAKGRKMLEEST